MNSLEQIMEINLDEVWSQRNHNLRLEKIKSLYARDAVLYEMGEEIKGHEAINDRVTALLDSLPSDFRFNAQKPGMVNKDMGRLFWTAGAAGQPPVQSGMDVILFEEGKIKSLYVFLDK